MPSRILISLAVLPFAACLAFAQSGMSAGCDSTSCRIAFTFGPYGIASTGSAAYSGRQTTETVRTLSDGTHITGANPISPAIYRDSQGRVRTERPAFAGPAGAKLPIDFAIVEIQDPVAGYIYVLDSVNQVAHRLPVQARPLPAGPQNGAPPGFSAPPSVDLGTQIMFGVTLTGRQTSYTAPAGSAMGNDQPITTVTETWTDPRTNVAVLRKSTSPTGNSTMTMQNYSNSEPDPSLFQIPPGYRVVDETGGSFTIVTPRAN